MATYQGQSLMSYPDSYGQYYQSTLSSIEPMETAVGWGSTRTPSKGPSPPPNYYNFHNSKYETSTELQHLNSNNGDEQSEFDYYYDENNTVGSKPSNKVEQYPNYSVQGYPEETSQYPDYYETSSTATKKKGGSSKGSKGTTVYRQKMGKLPAVEADDEEGHPASDYYDYHEEDESNLDNRIRNFRKNEAVFRQDGTDLNTIANYAAQAIKMLSLIFTVVSGGSSDSSSDRIDTGSLAAGAAAGGQASEVDLALGTLMAFGGKYLRQIAMYTWEHATNTPAEPLGAPTSQSGAPIVAAPAPAVVQEPSAPAASPSIADAGPQTPYLSTLSAQDLENLGLKAVAAGAEPTKLQQAFAAAQLDGDWSKLTNEMAAVLGPEAVGLTAGGQQQQQGGDVLSQASQLIQNIVGGPSNVNNVDIPPGVSSSSVPSTSQVPSGLTYYMAMAENYANRINKVINGPEVNQFNPNLSEDDQIAQQSIVTRFIKEFNLEQEALALQYQANSLIKQVNNLIEGSPSDKIDKIGGAGADDELITSQGPGGPTTSQVGGIGSFISAIPNALGQAAVSVIKFISPAAPQQLEEKIDSGPVSNGGVSYSEIQPTVDMDTVTYAALGMGAIGTVLYGIYAASGDKKRRSDVYKRSLDEERERAAEMLWASLRKHSLKEDTRR